VSAATESSVTGAAVRRVLWITLLLNTGVSAAKLVVGVLSGSLSMVADGYHSLLDGVNNVVGLVVAAWAHQPPDEEHPYGHRKFETFASIGLGLLLLGMAYNVLVQALGRFSTPQLPAIGVLNWVVMGVTLGVNVFTSWYERREGRRLGSDYLLADAEHTRSDIYVTLGVVVSFAGARAGVLWVDGAVAIAIGLFIGVLAARILSRAFDVLTDRAPIPAEQVTPVVQAVPGVLAVRSVRTRGGEGAAYVDLVAEMDGELTLHQAHEVADRIEAAVRQAHPSVIDVVVHPEPGPRVDEPA
jgi:cation diffusion facilitator family transporter